MKIRRVYVTKPFRFKKTDFKADNYMRTCC